MAHHCFLVTHGTELPADAGCFGRLENDGWWAGLTLFTKPFFVCHSDHQNITHAMLKHLKFIKIYKTQEVKNSNLSPPEMITRVCGIFLHFFLN